MIRLLKFSGYLILYPVWYFSLRLNVWAQGLCAFERQCIRFYGTDSEILTAKEGLQLLERLDPVLCEDLQRQKIDVIFLDVRISDFFKRVYALDGIGDNPEIELFVGKLLVIYFDKIYRPMNLRAFYGDDGEEWAQRALLYLEKIKEVHDIT